MLVLWWGCSTRAVLPWVGNRRMETTGTGRVDGEAWEAREEAWGWQWCVTGVRTRVSIQLLAWSHVRKSLCGPRPHKGIRVC